MAADGAYRAGCEPRSSVRRIPPFAAVLREARGKAKVLAVSARRIPFASRSFPRKAGPPGAQSTMGWRSRETRLLLIAPKPLSEDWLAKS